MPPTEKINGHESASGAGTTSRRQPGEYWERVFRNGNHPTRSSRRHVTTRAAVPSLGSESPTSASAARQGRGSAAISALQESRPSKSSSRRLLHNVTGWHPGFRHRRAREQSLQRSRWSSGTAFFAPALADGSAPNGIRTSRADPRRTAQVRGPVGIPASGGKEITPMA